MHKNFNKDHGYDEEVVKEHIKQWNESQLHADSVREYVDSHIDDLVNSRKKARAWKDKKTDPSKIRQFNLARNKMLNGLTQFFDGIGDALDIDDTYVLNSDFMNILGIMAYAKSSAFDKTQHWAKAEKEVQQSKNINLPGSTCNKGRSEKIERPEETENVWYGLQFMYRQFEVFRYVPNYDIVSSIWNLVAGQDRQVVHILDHWYYLHNSEIPEKSDLSDVTKGYFFRYNAKMTSQAQAETLFVLNCLFNHSGSQPLGTLEKSPWFLDSMICGSDGNLPYSTHITTQNIDKTQKKKLSKAPIVGKAMDGVRSMPSECESPKEFGDKDIATRVVNKKYDSKKEMKRDIEKKEKRRDGEKGYFKGKDGLVDQHWDQDDDQSYDQGLDLPDGANVSDEDLQEKVLKRGQGSVFYDDEYIVRKIIDSDGNEVSKLVTDRDKKYKVGREV